MTTPSRTQGLATYLGPTKAALTRWCSTWCPTPTAIILAVLNNWAGNAGVAVGYNTRQLPVLTLWKHRTRAQGYVTGIEPGTSYAYSTKYQRLPGWSPRSSRGDQDLRSDLSPAAKCRRGEAGPWPRWRRSRAVGPPSCASNPGQSCHKGEIAQQKAAHGAMLFRIFFLTNYS